MKKSVNLNSIYKDLHSFFGHQKWWPGDTPFEIMVGAILTQNTSWTNVEKAIQNLKREKVLTPEALNRISHERLAALLKPAGYFNVKAKRLKNFIDFLFYEYQGDLRRMKKEPGNILREKLLAVNGVGPETADSILLYALNKPFFVIDAYTKRIFSRHRILKFENPYELWRSLFETSLPRKVSLFNDFHAQIVAVGKRFCKTRNPDCSSCPLKIYL